MAPKIWFSGEDDFLPANENESFVQVDSITMSLRR